MSPLNWLVAAVLGSEILFRPLLVVVGDHSGSPLGQVPVQIKVAGSWTRYAITSDSGAARFDGLPEGQGVILVQVDGFVEQQVTVVIPAANASTTAIYLEPAPPRPGRFECSCESRAWLGAAPLTFKVVGRGGVPVGFATVLRGRRTFQADSRGELCVDAHAREELRIEASGFLPLDIEACCVSSIVSITPL